MTFDKRSLFIPQLLTLSALLLLTLLDFNPRVIVALLCTGLVGLWFAAAFVEPFSLLLSTLALAGTTNTLSHLYVDGVAFSVNGLLTAGLGAASGLAVVVHYRHQFRTVSQIRRWLLESAPISLLLLWAMIRTPGAPSLSNAISDLLIWGALLLVYVLARAYWTDHPYMLAVGEQAFLYVGFLTLIMIVGEALFGNLQVNYSSTEITLGIHTTVGARGVPFFFTLATIPVLLHLRFDRAKRANIRRLLMALIGVMAIWNYFSLARTSLLGLGGIVLPLALLRPRTLWKAASLVVGGAVITSGIILSPLYPRPTFVELDNVITIESQNDTEPGATNDTAGSGKTSPQVQVNSDAIRTLSFGRSSAWQYLINEGLRNNPIVGVGTGASRSYVPTEFSGLDHPHNDFIRAFFDLGVIGLLIFGISWAYKTLKLWLNWKRSRPYSSVAYHNLTAVLAVLYTLLGFLIENFIVYFAMMAPVWLLIAMADVSTAHAESQLGFAEQPAERWSPVEVEHVNTSGSL